MKSEKFEQENQSKMCKNRGQLIMSTIGSVTVIAGVLLAIFWPQIFDKILFKVRVCSNNRFEVKLQL